MDVGASLAEWASYDFYASTTLTDGQLCNTGILTDEDGMQHRPAVEMFDRNGAALWRSAIALPMVVIEVERAISGQGVVRVLERLALGCGLPKVIRPDDGKEFCGKAMMAWAHERGVALRLIEPAERNQNSFEH